MTTAFRFQPGKKRRKISSQVEAFSFRLLDEKRSLQKAYNIFNSDLESQFPAELRKTLILMKVDFYLAIRRERRRLMNKDCGVSSEKKIRGRMVQKVV